MKSRIVISLIIAALVLLLAAGTTLAAEAGLIVTVSAPGWNHCGPVATHGGPAIVCIRYDAPTVSLDFGRLGD